MTLNEIASCLRELQRDVRSRRFRGAERYVEDQDELAARIGRLAAEVIDEPAPSPAPVMTIGPRGRTSIGGRSVMIEVRGARRKKVSR